MWGEVADVALALLRRVDSALSQAKRLHAALPENRAKKFGTPVGPVLLPISINHNSPYDWLYVKAVSRHAVTVTEDGTVTWDVPWANVPLETQQFIAQKLT